MISATITGGTQLAAGLGRFDKEAAQAIKTAVDQTALAVESDAKKKLKADGHIITGRLFSSIHAETKEGQSFTYTSRGGSSYNGSLGQKIAKDEAIAGTNVEYGPSIEYDKDSFLGWAALQQKDKLVNRIKTELNKIVKKYSR